MPPRFFWAPVLITGGTVLATNPSRTPTVFHSRIHEKSHGVPLLVPLHGTNGLGYLFWCWILWGGEKQPDKHESNRRVCQAVSFTGIGSWLWKVCPRLWYYSANSIIAIAPWKRRPCDIMRQHIGWSVEQSWLIMRWNFPAIRFENWTLKGSILMIRESVSHMPLQRLFQAKATYKTRSWLSLPSTMQNVKSYFPYGIRWFDTDRCR